MKRNVVGAAAIIAAMCSTVVLFFEPGETPRRAGAVRRKEVRYQSWAALAATFAA
jgi:hypothetical protein